MKLLSFFGRSTAYTCGKLCRQYLLLGGLALLCLLLPIFLGSAVQQTMEDGVGFSGITMAVTAPPGDPIPELLEQYMGRMQDISRYCSVVAMERDEALQALKDSEVLAVLELPDGFVQGIMNGSNPDVILTVDENRPVESLLTLWVGQSAADLLSAVQSGIYAVLEQYDPNVVAELSQNQVVMEINLRYINWVLNRQDVFQHQTVSATQGLPVKEHYALSLLAWLCLSLAPLFYPIYSPARLTPKRRLRSIGWGSGWCFASDLVACILVLWLVAALPFMAIFQWHIPRAVLCAGVWAVFCACFGSLCCLITGSAAQCGGLAFLVSLGGLAVSGGILPPVMLPQTLRKIGAYSPVSWLRDMAAMLLEFEAEAHVSLILGVAVAVMVGLCALLYHKRVAGREVEQ